jgi:hypothetical protein
MDRLTPKTRTIWTRVILLLAVEKILLNSCMMNDFLFYDVVG